MDKTLRDFLVIKGAGKALTNFQLEVFGMDRSQLTQGWYKRFKNTPVPNEDMSPSVVWWEEESDEDYEERIKELHKKFLAERQEAKKQQERDKIEEEISLLKSRLNSL